ncbi:beta-galactosidase [uncultured Bacteroides sp.]|uniref:beta-galactosidase n=1 Tax=uncultured Bacteroides sp. TaxID=162156 RepID=UPI002AAB894C|nr:beta-galactosidase [uncultured Bacteroides sp.]
MKKVYIISGLFAACCLCNANASVHAVLKDNLHGVSLKSADKQNLYVVKVPKGVKVKGDIFHLGTAVNPEGSTVTFNSQSMLLNGKPVLPVMGEFHFSRYPEGEWRNELLKMKAGGINVVATYIFWIHHEEVEGKYKWTGQHDLHKFVELCHELGLYVVVRIGPWCHGEVRNGGFPEWMVNEGFKLRENNPEYLAKLQNWYSHIYDQVKGMMWKDGGPVIGVQLENEYGGKWEHLMTLKKMVREIGFDVPLYTRTGWPKLSTPATFGEIIPLYGDYADGFWDRSLKEMPGDYGKSYIFRSFRGSTVIATEQLPKQSDKDDRGDMAYPYLTCELGGGMMPSYHRRISIAPMDVYSMALVRVGSGSNLPGYYMYHGGTNPEGELSTLNEKQASNYTYWNDLPVKSYDFQAPLGEFGQINGQYHLLRRLHLFLHDFGSELTTMQPVFPANAPTNFNTDSLLRWCVRSDGRTGYVFVNNYHRLKPLAPKEGVQFDIDLPGGRLTFPSVPITVPSDCSFFWAFNMKLNGVSLVYATAQPIAKVTDGKELTVVFAKSECIPAEFVFEEKGVKILSSSVKVKRAGGRICFADVKPGIDAAIRLRDAGGRQINIVLLSDAASQTCWKAELAGKERLFLSGSGLTCDGNRLLLDAKTTDKAFVSIYPATQKLSMNGVVLKGSRDGMFTCYEINRPEVRPLAVSLKLVKEAGVARKIEMGKAKVAMQPEDSDFEKGAAVWNVELPEHIDSQRDLYLCIPYVGDVARIYLGNKLLTDNFYNGKPFELGLKRYASDIYSKELTISILPLSKDAPIYLPKQAWPDFKGTESIVTLPKVNVYEKQQIVLVAE